MKYVLSFLLLAGTLCARDYYPYVQVTKEGDRPGQLSGVVVDCKGSISVVTASHVALFEGYDDYFVTFYAVDGVRTVVPARIEKYDHGLDLMLLSFEKPTEVEVSPYSFGEPDYNMMAKVCGYVMNRRIVNNTSPKRDYNGGQATTQNGKPLLYCKGPCLSGMSGGALAQKGVLIGIQSTKANQGGFYVPADQVKKFIE